MALSAEILGSRNGGSDLGALGINYKFREKTGFCFKSALFSLNASEKGKMMILLITRSGAKATPTIKLNLLPVRRLFRIGSR